VLVRCQSCWVSATYALDDLRQVYGGDANITRLPAALIRAALLTGCRQEELASATVAQFDEARGQLTVVGKGNKRRTIDLSPAAIAVIRPTTTDTRYLFTSRHVDRYQGVATRFFDLVRGDYGIPTGPDNDVVVPFRFHDLRHRYAVDYLKAGGQHLRLATAPWTFERKISVIND
jgi:integrase